MSLRKDLTRIAIIATSAAFLLAALVPTAGAVSIAPFHVSPFALNNNFSYSVSTGPATGTCEVSSTSPMPPTPGGPCTVTTAVNLQACTTNFRVDLIKVRIVGPSGTTNSKTVVTGTKGSTTCITVTVPTSPTGTYTVTAKFYAMNPLPKPVPHEDIKGISVGQEIVTGVPTPVFPIGAVLGVVAPLAALLGYVKLRKNSLTAIS